MAQWTYYPLTPFTHMTTAAVKHFTQEEFDERIKNLKTVKDVTAFAKELIAPTLQTMLEAEMTEHLGYEKYDPAGRNSGNSRNGYGAKTLKTSFGPAPLKIPRDRQGQFDPLAVRKYETIDNDVEQRIISMYAKGMATRDIHQHMQEIYGIETSPGMVSQITDKVLPLIHEWQSRPLSSCYVLLYLDGIHFKIRDTGRIVNKCCYTVLGVNTEGKREILGLWISETESAKFWLEVLTEIKNRGVEDIIIASVDGLSGFSDAIKTVFPKTDIQQCVVHQIRNTIKYIPHKHKKAFCKDLRTVYSAPTDIAGLAALDAVKAQWPQYAVYLKSWEDKWHELSPMFRYPAEIRRLMYTTNVIENLHRQLRKVTKTTTIFPHEEALMKLLWLAQHDIARKWTLPIRDWGIIIAQFAILYPERIKLS
jgi:putative transposase